MEGQPLRVVLVDDHEMVRTGLKAMLSRFAGQVRVVGEAADAATARRVVAGLDPDIVLADVRLGGESGLDLCRELIADSPGRRVVLLTVYDDEQYLFQAMQAGAAGYLLKRDRRPGAGRAIATGARRWRGRRRGVLAPELARPAARLRAASSGPGAHLGLTHRESEVLSLMVGGLSNRAIATRLLVGEETVKSHVRGIYRKLAVSRPGRGRWQPRCARVSSIDGRRPACWLTSTSTPGRWPSSEADSVRRPEHSSRHVDGPRRPRVASRWRRSHRGHRLGRLLRPRARRRAAAAGAGGATPPFDEPVGQGAAGAGEGVAGWVAEHRPSGVVVAGQVEGPPLRATSPHCGRRLHVDGVGADARRGSRWSAFSTSTPAARSYGDDDIALLTQVGNLWPGPSSNARLYRRLAVRERDARAVRRPARSIDAQELERRRLAGDIHDGISQRLVSLWLPPRRGRRDAWPTPLRRPAARAGQGPGRPPWTRPAAPSPVCGRPCWTTSASAGAWRAWPAALGRRAR